MFQEGVTLQFVEGVPLFTHVPGAQWTGTFQEALCWNTPDTNEDLSKQETYIFIQAHLNAFPNASYPVACSYYYIISLKSRRDARCQECRRSSFCTQFGILHMPEYLNSAQRHSARVRTVRPRKLQHSSRGSNPPKTEKFC